MMARHHSQTLGERYGRHIPKRTPYARRLERVIANPATWPQYEGTSPDGTHLTLWVLTGSRAWDAARVFAASRRLYVVAPPDEDPTGYDWRVLRGHDPIIILRFGDLDGETVRALVTAMMRDGVHRVLDLAEHAMSRYVAAEEVSRVT